MPTYVNLITPQRQRKKPNCKIVTKQQEDFKLNKAIIESMIPPSEFKKNEDKQLTFIINIAAL